MRYRKAIGTAAILGLSLGIAPGPSQATTDRTAGRCSLALGSLSADSTSHTTRTITATSPVTVSPPKTTSGAFKPPYAITSSTTFTNAVNGDRFQRWGKVISGDALYDAGYQTDFNGELDPTAPPTFRRIGGGWGAMRWVEQSTYIPADPSQPGRTTLYAQRTNGWFDRWIKSGSGWRGAYGGIGGLSTMKSFALINRTATQDTFLVNNRNGGLYTLSVIPDKFPQGVRATAVRTRTWQVFEQMIATPCGRASTLLLGIDRDTKTGYLYAVGHHNGAATPIQGLGKVPLQFSDPLYFRLAPEIDRMNG
ncbi:hypothetical protein [Kribbella sancticallisti]